MAKPTTKRTSYGAQLGRHIRALRVAADLSVDDLARRIKRRVNCVYDWEAGTTSPHVDMLPLIAKALGKSVRDILPPEK
jgi:transcriptional regulator with XRE-family HTH domain